MSEMQRYYVDITKWYGQKIADWLLWFSWKLAILLLLCYSFSVWGQKA